MYINKLTVNIFVNNYKQKFTKKLTIKIMCWLLVSNKPIFSLYKRLIITYQLSTNNMNLYPKIEHKNIINIFRNS